MTPENQKALDALKRIGDRLSDIDGLYSHDDDLLEIEEALTALSRIEAVETVTVQDFEDVIENATAEEVMALYPNGVKIVEEE